MSLTPCRGMLGGLVTLLGRLPLHPFLLAAYAVLFLYSVNVDEVLPVDAASPLVMSVVGALAVTAALAILFRDLRRAALVATAAVVTFYGFGHLAPTLARVGLDDRAQLVTWGILVVGTVVFAFRAQASLPRATAGLNVIGFVLVIVASATIVPYEIQRAARTPIAPISTVEAAGDVARRPDIYFLVFDRYGSADAIDRRFDLENDLPEWLESQGFTVAAGSHANYRATDFSLAATLNMQFLDTLTAKIGSKSRDRTPAYEMIQDHAVGRFLKGQGYRYYQLGSWFGPTKSVRIADENIVLGVTSEFETVLRDTTIVPAVERLLGTAVETEPVEERTHLERHRDGTLFALRQLRRVSTAPGPKFVFAHILLPHDPYVFRADGSPLPEQEARDTEERELYAGHLAFTNAQIREIVGYLLSGPEAERPIVIIEGDEGPLACRRVDCVTNTPEYLRIRLGNLIAMYLPEIDADLPDSFTSVNTFRLVFREYFGADLPPLPDRSFTWPDNDHIYAFRDVTDLIREPKVTRSEPPS